MSLTFDRAFEYIAEVEGGYTANPQDPGNWTGRSVGQGILKGTKWGISAGSYPDLDIANLSKDQAKQIYYDNYWRAIEGETHTPELALMAFDAAVHSGVGTAKRLLRDSGGNPYQFISMRIRHLLGLQHRETFETGWMLRIATLLEHLSNLSNHNGMNLSLLQIFEGSATYEYTPIATTMGTTEQGGQKLMVRVPPKWYKPWTWIRGRDKNG